MTLKVISLFSGCGGADLGLLGGFKFINKNYKKLPFEIVHASDIDAKAVNTYNLNFKHKALHADVCNLSFEKNYADVVIGGFPCQSFSTVNPNKDPEDERAQLYNQMARIIKQVKPKYFIAENVRGFYTLQNGKFFKAAKKKFSEAGYNVYAKILDASEFGIPQKRIRLFIVGVRKDLNIEYKFPNPQTGDSPLKPKAILKDVIENLIPEDEKYYFSERAVQGVKNAKPNMKRALAQDLNNQCLTISSHLAKASLNSRDPVLLVNPKKELYRRFTPKEAARIQAFPDKFKFSGSDADAYRQIGNAIPPLLMWHVCNSILDLTYS